MQHDPWTEEAEALYRRNRRERLRERSGKYGGAVGWLMIALVLVCLLLAH
jgi:hypothetical protein